MKDTNISYLKQLESESIHIIREVAAEFKNPVMLYSIGKDSSVMVRLAQKAFYPGKIPFPLMHIDTGFKFTEMIEFRDWYVKEIGCRLIVEKNEVAISEGTHPQKIGVDKCCAKLKTQGLLGGIKSINLMRPLAERVEMRKNQEQKNVYSLSEMNSGSGIPSIKDLNSGIYIIAVLTRKNQSGCFP